MYRLKATDVMTLSVITVYPETPIPEVARLLVEHRISGVPVVDFAGNLLGIVTEADLLAKGGARVAWPKVGFFPLSRETEVREHQRRYEGKIAADLMTREVVTGDEEMTLREAAATMAQHRINRIPILRDGRMLGIVTRNDILKAFLRGNDELVRFARDAILHELQIDPATLDISARNGIVTIQGHVEREIDARMLQTLVRGIDGVVDADISGLRHNVDAFGVPRLPVDAG